MRQVTGFALITALVFLVVLSFVALIALRGTGLEARMSANNGMQNQAFESSEASRRLLDSVADDYVFSHGPPTTLPTGFQIATPASAPLWYSGNTETGTFNPSKLDQDATYSTVLGAGGSAITLAGTLDVYKLRTALLPGSGAAMVAGYEGAGHGSAGGGSAVFLYLNSQGQDLSGAAKADADTATIYRALIRK